MFLFIAGGVVLLPPRASGDLAVREPDREAILSLAGAYEVTFRFEETVALRDGYRLREPQHSTALEIVVPVVREKNRIVLQHILLAGDNRRVVKHWRQDWRYEPETLLRYRGGGRWERRELSPVEAAGRWSQTVYQVDDSPRYGVLGRWSHGSTFSEWRSEPDYRPLPRREYTTRDDYNRFLSQHRFTVSDDGWAHEQDNIKIHESGDTRHLLVREHGVNTYRRAGETDFSAAEDYWEETCLFWADVRAFWNDFVGGRDAFSLATEADGERMWRRMFALAREVREAGDYEPGARSGEIAAIVNRYRID